MTKNTMNDAGLDLVKTFEGLELTAYEDQGGVATIGYGHTGPDVYSGLRISMPGAEYLLRKDLFAAIDVVATEIGEKPTTSNQFSAMVSLCFNIGAEDFLNSTVLKCHSAGQYPTAAAAFLLWDKVTEHGSLVVSDGLVRRRKAERALYLTPNGDAGDLAA